MMSPLGLWRSLKIISNAVVVAKAITRLYCMVEDGMIRRLNEKRGDTSLSM